MPLTRTRACTYKDNCRSLGLPATATEANKGAVQADGGGEAEERTETDPNIVAVVQGMTEAVNKISVREDVGQQEAGDGDGDIARLTLGQTEVGINNPLPNQAPDKSGMQKEKMLRKKLLKKKRWAAASRVAGSFLEAKESILRKKREYAEEDIQLPIEETEAEEQQNHEVLPDEVEAPTAMKTKHTRDGTQRSVEEDGSATSLGAVDGA